MDKELRTEAGRSIDHLIARGFVDEANIVGRVANELLYTMEDSGDASPRGRS
jgi:hypothetical protein